MRTTAAFVTIGQSPRLDLVPEMRAEIEAGLPPDRLSITEFGVLDGMDEGALERMRAVSPEPCFATRLADGREIIVSISRIEAALETLIARLDGQFDLIVLLCTGAPVRAPGRSTLIGAQPLVDGFVATLSPTVRELGVILPGPGQAEGFGREHGLPWQTRYYACSPYVPGDFAQAGAALTGCDLVVMHCIGYTAAMGREVARTSGARVLLARRIVAREVRQLLAA